jgi:6-phosphofructokinase 1
LNHVVRSLVFELHHKYRVRDILGYRYGFAGLGPGREPPLDLGPSVVRHIHRLGGSLLGLSRGHQQPSVMLETLARDGVNVLFTIGGDGTLRGAHALALEAERQGQALSVVGVPKTIDNDVPWVDKTFGFDTAVELACVAVDGAHTEALSALRGVGIVKLMGRDAGFITAAAAIASGEANFCLVPEVPFDLEGPHGLLAAVEARLRTHSHALLVVAEGCAARVFDASRGALDASGNVRYASDTLDIGPYLRERLQRHLQDAGLSPTIKYIDPSYMIRSVPANASDGIFCDALARNAVHAAMAGRTDVVVGRWHRVFTHLPLTVATATRKSLDPDGALWLAVTEMTGQPPLVPRHPGWRRSTRPAAGPR